MNTLSKREHVLKTSLILGLVAVCGTFLFSGCINAAGGSSVETVYTLDPPTDFTAGFDSGGVTLSWSAAARTERYVVLRCIDDGDYVEIQRVEGVTFHDGAIPADGAFRYAVASSSGTEMSANAIDGQTFYWAAQGQQATRFTRTDGVRLDWTAHDHAERYIVYRSGSATGEFQKIGEVTAPNTSYLDTPTAADTAYYYQVRWVTSDYEYGGGGDSVIGGYSDVVIVDPTEEVSDSPEALPPGTSEVDPEKPPYIYSVPDEEGVFVHDSDWYRYAGSPYGAVSVTVSPKDTSLEPGDIGVRFWYEDVAYEAGTVDNVALDAENVFIHDDFGSSPPATVDLFIEVYVTPSVNRTIHAQYMVDIAWEATGGGGALGVPSAPVAQFVDGAIDVTWADVTGATGYRLYRTTGNGSPELIETTESRSYTDSSYNRAATIAYSVEALRDDAVSGRSPRSVTIYEYVDDLQASRLEYDDKVVVRWKANPSADEYRVYRVAALVGGTFEYIGSVTTGTEYEDTSADSDSDPDSGYYYQIRWKNDTDSTDFEYNEDGERVFGIHLDAVDVAEPDNDSIESPFTFTQHTAPFGVAMYHFPGAVYSKESDVDWYRIETHIENPMIHITIDSGSFATGDLLFEGPNGIGQPINPAGPTSFVVRPTGGAVLFAVYAASGAGDFSVRYTIDFAEGL